jgi:hypothetical protein
LEALARPGRAQTPGRGKPGGMEGQYYGNNKKLDLLLARNIIIINYNYINIESPY